MTEPTLRDLLSGPATALAVGARDGLTARLVAAAGFDALWLSSFELSAAHALPDMGLLTLTECLEAVRMVRDASSLPLLVDADTGFGGAKNVSRTATLLEAAGASGLCIEDKVFPKRNSFLPGQTLESAEEFAAHIGIACRARRTAEFVVVARCEAFIAGTGLADALRRCHMYVDAGADAVLIHSKAPTPVEIESFLREWHGRAPVVVVLTTYDNWSVSDAATAGVQMVIYTNQALRASVKATEQVLKTIFDSGRADSVGADLAPVNRIFELTDVDKWDNLRVAR